MMKVRALGLVITLMAGFNQIGISRSQSRTQSLEATGTVIAYDQLIPLMNITAAPQVQILVARLSRRIRGQEGEPYIKVVYQYGGERTSLPKEIFDGKSQWHFILERDDQCDSSLRELKATKPQNEDGRINLPRLKFTSAIEGLADDSKLPCYVLKSDGYRLQK